MNVKCIDKCVNKIVHRKIKVTEDNQNDFYKADFLGKTGKEFRNYGGYPRNPIAIINEQQNLEVANALMQQITILPDDTKIESKVSDSDLKMMMRSRYAQTPSEQIAHIENVLKVRDDRIAAERQRVERVKAARQAEREREELYRSLNSDELASLNAKKREREIDKLLDNA